jgi:hypothetical protein
MSVWDVNYQFGATAATSFEARESLGQHLSFYPS